MDNSKPRKYFWLRTKARQAKENLVSFKDLFRPEKYVITLEIFLLAFISVIKKSSGGTCRVSEKKLNQSDTPPDWRKKNNVNIKIYCTFRKPIIAMQCIVPYEFSLCFKISYKIFFFKNHFICKQTFLLQISLFLWTDVTLVANCALLV